MSGGVDMRNFGLGLMAAVLCAGCSGGNFASAGGGGGTFGATQGGVQDMRFARELVAAGQVPPPEAFVVEGMFSEHDLPLDGAPCTRTFCARAAAGIAPTPAGTDASWVQLGLASSIDPA